VAWGNAGEKTRLPTMDLLDDRWGSEFLRHSYFIARPEAEKENQVLVPKIHI
jgi:hypothetical protein